MMSEREGASVSTAKAAPEAPTQDLVSRSPKQLAWIRFKQNKTGILAASVAAFFMLAAFLAPVICGFLNLNPTSTYSDQLNEFGMPKGTMAISWTHPLGVEPGAGRDVLAMLLYGSRISFTFALIASVVTIGLGLVIGIFVGYFRGWVDATVGRFSDFLLAFPLTFMIVALSLPMTQRVENISLVKWIGDSSGIGKENGARLLVLLILFAFFGWPGFTRLIRSQVLSLRERDFVMAAKSLGSSTSRIVFKELLPNLWSPVIVFLSLSLPGYLSGEAAFSYLGVGVQPPATTWGLLLSDGINYWSEEPIYLLIPALMLIVVVLALNVLGDAVRDALDPKGDR
jgi:peptide/nickel transport system permease protein